MKWQKIENKPDDGQWALVYMGNCPYRGVDRYRAGFFVDGEFLSAANACEVQGITPSYWITHWKPLDEPPKED